MTQTALITGGSGGIGRACALALAPTHDIAVQYYQNETAATEITSQITTEYECDAAAFQCDVADPDSVRGLVEKTEQKFESVNVLVNNAGVFLQRCLEQMSRKEIDHTLETNLRGAIYCSREVLSAMCRRQRGHIISVASTAGTRGSGTDPVYSASKGGLIAFTK